MEDGFHEDMEREIYRKDTGNQKNRIFIEVKAQLWERSPGGREGGGMQALNSKLGNLESFLWSLFLKGKPLGITWFMFCDSWERFGTDQRAIFNVSTPLKNIKRRIEETR